MSGFTTIPSPSTSSMPSWKTIAILTLGGIAVGSTAVLLMNWKSAVTGRKVEELTLNFLRANGSSVSGGYVSGGLVETPLKIDDAVVNTVGNLMHTINNAMAQAESKKRRRQSSPPDVPEYEMSAGATRKKPANRKPATRDDDDDGGDNASYDLKNTPMPNMTENPEDAIAPKQLQDLPGADEAFDGSGASSSHMEGVVDIPLVDNSQKMAEVIAQTHLGLLQSEKVTDYMSITAGQEDIPHPIKLEEAMKYVEGSVYDLSYLDGCNKVQASLRLRSAPGSLSPGVVGFDVEFPLVMLPYKTPENPRMCFDPKTCKKVDKINDEIERHNLYVVSLLSAFIAKNGCGTSAKHVTLPSAAPLLADTRNIRIKELKSDKYSYLKLAVKYLGEAHRKYAGMDYDIDDAVELADKLAMEFAINERLEKAKKKGYILAKLPGYPPSRWSGVNGESDSAGRHLEWKAAPLHSFIYPDIEIVEQTRALITVSGV